MFRTIQKPYKMNYKLYATIIILSLSFVFVSWMFNRDSCIREVCNGIGYGCFGSSVVALLIDFVNTQHNNQKANQLEMLLPWRLSVNILLLPVMMG